MSVQQPIWTPVKSSEDEPVLKVYNSLTRSKASLRLKAQFLPSLHVID